MPASSGRTTIAVAICTYKRNEPLAVLLESLIACAERVRERSAVGVVIVDDTKDELARPVAEAFAGRFELGLLYRVSGKQNISMARNLAIETAMNLADWTAMTDDDCEAPAHWLEALLETQARTGADAVTGRMVRRVPDGSPRWITEEPFLELGVEQFADGTEMPSAATFNTMISSSWLKANPEIRFAPAYGVVGGEDMVFFRAAKAAGLSIRFSEQGFVYENEFRREGDASAISSTSTSGTATARRFPALRAACRARECSFTAPHHWFGRFGRPFGRLLRGEKPQLRFGLAQVLHAVGKLLGTFGVRIEHR